MKLNLTGNYLALVCNNIWNCDILIVTFVGVCMNYIQLERMLFEIKDEKFSKFSKSLSNSDYVSIGVKMPMLKEIIKQHKNDKELLLDDFNLGKYLEIDFIYFGLGVIRQNTLNSQLYFLMNNINKAKSWVITDGISPMIKKYSLSDMWEYFLQMKDSKYTYTRRMAYVLALKNYRDKDILKILKFFVIDKEYMVTMAKAWLIATIAICYPNEIYEFLKVTDDELLKRKTISKICDSKRIPPKIKDDFKNLR